MTYINERMLTLIMPLALLFWVSCEDSVPELSVDKTVSTTDPVVQHILNLGFNLEDIVEFSDRYMVEGDIAFEKDMELPKGLASGHWRDVNLLAENMTRIEVVVDMSTFPDTEADDDLYDFIDDAMKDAMGEWNSAQSRIHFDRVDEHLPLSNTSIRDKRIGQITIIAAPRGNANDGDGDAMIDEDLTCGSASFPTASGKPFQTVTVYEDDGNRSRPSLATTIVHEIGHCVGLRHTNVFDTDGIYLPGTNDVNSVMNKSGCGNTRFQFTTGDRQAIQCILDPTCADDPPPPCNVSGVGAYWVPINNSIRASASTAQNSTHTRFYWEVTGGYIAGPSSGSHITVIPYCPTPRTVQIRAKTDCDPAWASTQITVNSPGCNTIF